MGLLWQPSNLNVTQQRSYIHTDKQVTGSNAEPSGPVQLTFFAGARPLFLVSSLALGSALALGAFVTFFVFVAASCEGHRHEGHDCKRYTLWLLTTVNLLKEHAPCTAFEGPSVRLMLQPSK